MAVSQQERHGRQVSLCGFAKPAASLQHSILRLFDPEHDLGNRPDLDRAVFEDLAVVSSEPAVVVIVPLIYDAVADDRVLAVAELVRLILALHSPFALELLAAMLDVGLDGGIFRVAFYPEHAARPLLFVTGAGP